MKILSNRKLAHFHHSLLTNERNKVDASAASQSAYGALFDLANALACEFVVVADFIKAFLRTAYAERHTQNALLTFGEQVERVTHLLAEIFLLEPGVGGRGVVVG